MKRSFDLRTALRSALTESGLEWRIKGVVDADKKLYTLSNDTKLISKVFELVAFPVIIKAVEPYGITWETEDRQTVYPDLTLILPIPKPNKLAVDIKSTYRRNGAESFTLGSYTAYMRPPYTKNIRYKYDEYLEHWIIGFIYSRVPNVKPDIRKLSDLNDVTAPIKDVELIIQEKWRVASDRPGSGNTTNIGSVRYSKGLKDGKGPFTEFGDNGKEVFEHYWRNFDRVQPRRFSTLETYKKWKDDSES